MSRFSNWRDTRSRMPSAVVVTIDSIGRSRPSERVRPPVRAYAGTSRRLPTLSRSCPRLIGATSPPCRHLQLRPERGCEHLAHAVDQQAHLVADETDVALGGSEDGEARPLADGRDEQVAGLHLHDELTHLARFEARRRAP